MLANNRYNQILLTITYDFMKMFRIILILTVIVFSACGHGETSNKSLSVKTSSTKISKKDKIANALSFINGYVENVNKMDQSVDLVEWVNSSNLATKRFKREVKE